MSLEECCIVLFIGEVFMLGGGTYLQLYQELIIRAKALDEEAVKELSEIVFLKIPPGLKVLFYNNTYQDIEDALQEALTKFISNPMSVKANSIGMFLFQL